MPKEFDVFNPLGYARDAQTVWTMTQTTDRAVNQSIVASTNASKKSGKPPQIDARSPFSYARATQTTTQFPIPPPPPPSFFTLPRPPQSISPSSMHSISQTANQSIESASQSASHSASHPTNQPVVQSLTQSPTQSVSHPINLPASQSIIRSIITFKLAFNCSVGPSINQ